MYGLDDKLSKPQNVKPSAGRGLKHNCGSVLGLEGEAEAVAAPTGFDGAAVPVKTQEGGASEGPTRQALDLGDEGGPRAVRNGTPQCPCCCPC